MQEQNENTVRWVVLGFGILFFALELFKQLFHNVFEGWEGYDWHIFPFQYVQLQYTLHCYHSFYLKRLELSFIPI